LRCFSFLPPGRFFARFYLRIALSFKILFAIVSPQIPHRYHPPFLFFSLAKVLSLGLLSPHRSSSLHRYPVRRIIQIAAPRSFPFPNTTFPSLEVMTGFLPPTKRGPAICRLIPRCPIYFGFSFPPSRGAQAFRFPFRFPRLVPPQMRFPGDPLAGLFAYSSVSP